MNKTGPIIIIEDDEDDRLILDEIFKNLNYKNEITYFENGGDALKYLTESDVEPFIILSDINMPALNGLELREKIYNNEKLRVKCIPYLFFSTSAEQSHVVDPYSKSIQGFFIKPTNFDRLQQTKKTIIQYWMECVSPNYVR
ncbi:response regulator [Dyadobacter sp. 3J3]|uniref:response regulator n=1 Tax=Dyadobacter sp. 3J3 TaxID=2606600 RepID=UPI00135A72AF|nr:response regulator [Dyadobacter sp. 3J3]